jgi:predicted nucleotidyltransferase component of viral defense system
MPSLEELKSYFPKSLHQFERFILREYLQYKILEIIFEGPYENKLAFLGGTCLRIVHNNNRFSEDLDFDNFNLTIANFVEITNNIKTRLETQGYQVELRNVEKGAFHCYLRFPELLFNEGITNQKEEKILIRLDTEPHQFNFEIEKPLLNKFDVFTQIKSTPKELLLAQKFYAVLNRKRNKGRDFFDIVFLLGQGIIPDYKYLEIKIKTGNPDDLRNRIIEKCNSLDMKEMAKDVSPFLFNKNDEKRILLFSDYIKQAGLE